jgi:geranylgeranyl diphosphate synthase, type I
MNGDLMSLASQMQSMLPAVEEELQAVVTRTTNPAYPDLRGMLAYHLGWEGPGSGPEAQGKRVRPLLVLLCAQAGGADWRKALPAAAAVELLHNFSLIHDDIQDNSPLRRGRETVWKVWGVPQAINAGDVMFTQAFRALHRLSENLSAQIALTAHCILEETCLKLTEGQYLDISYETLRSLPLDNYWAMIGGKTSALLGCCAELGALCAEVDDTRRASYREYGYSLGLAFQVLDDWLGIWGDAGVIGKSTESDLVSGKKTLPVLYGLEHNPEFAHKWASGGFTPEDIAPAVRMLDECGAGGFALAQAEELTSRALSALDQAVVLPGQAEVIKELTASLLKRKK